MSSNAATNRFATAMKSASNHTVGAKGANQYKSTENLMLDGFLGLKQSSTPEYIKSTITELVRQLDHMPIDQRGEWVADIFRIWVHKRHPRVGEKEKLLGQRMFFELYNHFPETCIELVNARIFADMAYWKDALRIWSMINETSLTNRQRFDKYNPLIVAIRDSFMDQRSEDLKALDSFLTPVRIRDISKTDMVARLKAVGAKAPQLTWIGKYCVRETSPENKRLYWFVQDDGGRLLRQSHVSFMLRKSLKSRVGPSEYHAWPADKSVPFGAKQSWRTLNAKLDEALDVPEVKASLNRLDEIDPSKLPGEFTKRNIKFLLNEKVKKAPTDAEEHRGNRRPDDPSRVDLRVRTRDMFTDPSRMNVGTLMPHTIAYSALNATSRAQIDYHNAAFDKKVQDGRADLDRVRAEMVESARSSTDIDHDAIARAMTSGNIVGVADVSGSMTTTAGGNAPNRPIDIATGLVSFISCIAREPYRDLAISFTDIPKIFSFKTGDRPMNVRERIQAMMSRVGYNTNFQGIHKELISLCIANKVPEDELPVIYVASDMQFDQCDKSMTSRNNYNYNTGCYETPRGGKSSSSIWESTHQTIEKMWIRAGYKSVPLMVFHNINVGNSGVQATQNYKGVILLTGRSEQVIKLVLYGEASDDAEKEIEVDGVKTTVKVKDVTPYDTFRKAMLGDHFDLLERVLKASTEGHLCHFS
jgi:hypothetical protein